MALFNNRRVDGANHPGSKLTDEERICIRHAKGRWPAARLAKVFGVTPGTIREVQRRPQPNDV